MRSDLQKLRNSVLAQSYTARANGAACAGSSIGSTRKYKLHVRVFMSKYRGYTLCPDCEGARLRQEARDVRVGGKTLLTFQPCRLRMPRFL